ncbi:hypothetical protein FACS1894116_13250 [Betaproteobacteria bacterium]|nr:hypothetical protein FACS1894116_13250 [Betaproteobacteria bacterium]GHU22732.1 hypothetical protein FACS189488_03870 [Betaproteobacteria bacterium]GHU31404.1 hypothetical protein FACS189497_12190 [Betaproteobacteria bacterium]
MMFLNAGKPFLSTSVLNYGFPYYVGKQGRMDEALRERYLRQAARIGINELDHTRVRTEIEKLERTIMVIQQA